MVDHCHACTNGISGRCEEHDMSAESPSGAARWDAGESTCEPEMVHEVPQKAASWWFWLSHYMPRSTCALHFLDWRSPWLQQVLLPLTTGKECENMPNFVTTVYAAQDHASTQHMLCRKIHKIAPA